MMVSLKRLVGHTCEKVESIEHAIKAHQRANAAARGFIVMLDGGIGRRVATVL
jgi:hypothetical protein